MDRLIYLHIPKTAGMTLRQVIYRQYMGEKTLTFSEHHKNEVKAFISLPQAERDDYQAIVGHIHYGVHEYLTHPARYITLLRDPVERIISSYYQVSRNPEHPRYPHYKDMSLLEYAQKETRGARQTRWLVGFRPNTPADVYTDEHPLPENALEIAKQHLDQMAVVGLVEKFDETLLLLRKAFHWRNVHYASRNVNTQRPRVDTHSPETLEIIRQHAEPDLSLYAYAKTLFERQSQAYGHTLATDLQRFQNYNRFYGHMMRLTEPLRDQPFFRQMRLWTKGK